MKDTIMETIRELINTHNYENDMNPKFVIITNDLAVSLAKELYHDYVEDRDEPPTMSLDDTIDAVYSGETKLYGLTLFVLNSRNRKNRAIWIG